MSSFKSPNEAPHRYTTQCLEYFRAVAMFIVIRVCLFVVEALRHNNSIKQLLSQPKSFSVTVIGMTLNRFLYFTCAQPPRRPSAKLLILLTSHRTLNYTLGAPSPLYSCIAVKKGNWSNDTQRTSSTENQYCTGEVFAPWERGRFTVVSGSSNSCSSIALEQHQTISF